ncbi:MAG: hypothetical protein QG608_1756 [Actinomycetota bacterium]|nr:hypothetical protein [Actinomycetota bacterium]
MAVGCAGSGYLTDRVDLAATGAIAGGIGLAAERWSSRSLRRRLRRERAQFRWETQTLQASVDELRRELTQVVRSLEALRSTVPGDTAVTGGIVVADRAARSGVRPPVAADALARAGTCEIDLRAPLGPAVSSPATVDAPPTVLSGADEAAEHSEAVLPVPGPPGEPAPHEPVPLVASGPIAVRAALGDTAGGGWFALGPVEQPGASGTPANGVEASETQVTETGRPSMPGSASVSLFQPAAERQQCEPDTVSTPLPLFLPGLRTGMFSPPYGLAFPAGTGGAQPVAERPRELILPDSAAWVRDLRPARPARTTTSSQTPRRRDVDDLVQEVLQEAGEITRSGGPALDRLSRPEETGEILVVGAGANVRSLAGALADRRGRHLA